MFLFDAREAEELEILPLSNKVKYATEQGNSRRTVLQSLTGSVARIF
jgi:hypothetical protein